MSKVEFRLVTLQMLTYGRTQKLLSVEGVGGQGSAFKAVTDVAQVRYPPEVDGYGVEADEEPGEQKERHGHYGGQEDAVLHVHGRPHDQTDRLGHERYQQARSQEHGEPEAFRRLARQKVNYRHVQNAKYSLET